MFPVPQMFESSFQNARKNHSRENVFADAKFYNIL